VRLERVNKWPNSMTDIWWLWIGTSQFVRLFCDLYHLFSEVNVVFSSFCLSIELQSRSCGSLHLAPTGTCSSYSISRIPATWTRISVYVHCSCVQFSDVNVALSRRRTACGDGISFRTKVLTLLTKEDSSWTNPVPGLWVRILFLSTGIMSNICCSDLCRYQS